MMKAYRNRYIIFSLSFLSFLLVIALNHLPPNPADAQNSLPKPVPTAIYPCLPGAKQGLLEASKPFVRGYFKDRDKEYYVIEMLYQSTPPFEDYEGVYEAWGRFFVVLDSVGCLPLNSQETASELIFAPLTQVVPEPIARALALQWWKYQLSLSGSPQKLKEELLVGLKPGPEATVLFSEDIWALSQLGITFPPKLLNQSREI